MSDRREKCRINSLRVLIPLMFILLAATFQGLMILYWQLAAAPMIRSESETAAKAMAYFQSNEIADALSARDGGIEAADITKLMDLSMLVTNPVTGAAFIQGIQLELDPEAFDDMIMRPHIRRGVVDCRECYVTEVPLFDRDSRELLGIATFAMSMEFFTDLKRKMVDRFMALSALTLLLILAAWVFTVKLIKPLRVLTDFLRQKDARHLGATPELSRLAPQEIIMVKTAMDDLMSRAQVHADRLDGAYQQLKSAQAQLVQAGRLASIGELAAGVAHELNQPLMVIRGTAQILARNPSAFSSDELADQLKTVERNTRRMMNIIEHLRTFSRQSTACFDSVDVNGVIQDAFLMVGEQLRLRNIEVSTDLAPGLPECRGNPNQLEQVFLNLITNARDAMIAKFGMGGDPDEHQGKLTLRTMRASQHVLTVVQDNGIGIPEDIREKIFNPFFTTKDVGKGTGLGLSISYGIIEAHNGRIEVESATGKGTMFTVFLPIKDSQ